MDAIQYVYKAVFRADNITLKGILDAGISLKVKKYNDKRGRITFYIDIEEKKVA